MVNTCYKVVVSENAQNDIYNISAYITYSFYNLQASKRIMTRLYNFITILKDFPYIGSKSYDDLNRVLIYKQYLIFYEIKENEKIVLIKSVTHSRQNIR